MTKQKLASQIFSALYAEELLNELDANSYEDLDRVVKEVIMDCLKDFVIIQGQILE